jgi:hypothetical protein
MYRSYQSSVTSNSVLQTVLHSVYLIHVVIRTVVYAMAPLSKLFWQSPVHFSISYNYSTLDRGYMSHTDTSQSIVHICNFALITVFVKNFFF